MPLKRQSLAVRGAVAVALTASLTVLARSLLHSPSTGIDDADIFLVYARNVSAGHGFVFNPGGDRVEGFTSLLWVLACSAVVAATEHPEAVLLILCVVLLSAAVTMCLDSIVPPKAPIVFLVLLLSDPRFVAWNTVTLMDTSLWCFLVTASAVMVLRDDDSRSALGGICALSVLLVLARPEALFWVPVLGVLVFMRSAVQQGVGTGLRRTLPILGVFVASEALLTAFRLSYFGFPLPNTYYAKVSPSLTFRLAEGWRYLTSYIASSPVSLLAAIGVFGSLVHVLKRGIRHEPLTMTLGVLGAMGLLLPVISGGDHFGGFRFYQAFLPILVLNLIHAALFVAPQYAPADSLRHWNRWKPLGTVVLASVFLGYQTLEWIGFGGNTQLATEFTIARAGRARGREAGLVFDGLPVRPRIATVTVGGFQYAYDGAIVDLMGLNNVEMAHNGGSRRGVKSHAAFEKATFYELRPQVLVPLMQVENSLPALQRRNGFTEVVLKGLLDEAEFQRRYALAEVRPVSNSSHRLAGYYDRAFLADLERSRAFAITVVTPDE